MSNVSLEYLLLFKSSGYCWDGNLYILYYCNAFGNLFFGGGGRGGGQNGPTHALYNKL